MRLLVDTNVFLDLLLKRESGCKEALDFFIWCKKSRNQTYITSMSLRDIEYIAERKLHDKEKAKSVLSGVYCLCSKVIGISADAAITSIYEEYKDFEDELIIQAAKEAMLDAIITNNIKDFANCDIPVYKPEELVALAEKHSC